ncbi:hypothetical protein [Mycobacteroides chelonae]|uniref:hypothetical protein n=1 Tax=Mycobacteroides chelonae TaxID=1774 RepID=UPI000992357E|nr:hypothetical protein [Mycobacteroides chelonae]
MSEQTQIYELYLALPKGRNASTYGFSAIRLFRTRELADLFVQRKNEANYGSEMEVVPIPLTEQVPEVVDTYHASWMYAIEKLKLERYEPHWSDEERFQPKPDPVYGQYGAISRPQVDRRATTFRVVNDCTKEARIESSAPSKAGAIKPIVKHLRDARISPETLSKLENELDGN